MDSELVQRTQTYLFADEKEMVTAGLTAPQRIRLLRIRDMYAYWLRYPKTTERDLVLELKHRYKLTSDTQAYEDIRLVKICLGTLNQVTKDYDRYRFRQLFEEGIEVARQEHDANAYARLLAAYGKYMQLDKEEADAPAYSDIVPQSFILSTDPSVLGFKPIKDWRKVAARLEARMIKESEVEETDFEELPEDKPLKPRTYKNQKENGKEDQSS
ncbi:MAG: hypothetical protein IJP75_10660 [Bacteroidaceae bacterium]|nr:hypothetical protein [Bacteroidaceae bacterium]